MAALVGCASIPKVPRVEDAGQGKAIVHIPRNADLQPVELEEKEFQQAVRRLAREARLTGTPRQTAETAFQIHEALNSATATCRSVVECRVALTDELRRLAKQIATPGTGLNRLVTQ